MAKRPAEGADVYKKLEDKIRAHTLKTTKHYDVARTRVQLNELSLDACPQLEVVDFYGNYFSPEDEYIPENELDRSSTGKRFIPRETVDLGQLFSEFNDGHITFIGPAGSGKTTLMKSIARSVSEHNFPYLEEVDFVHFLEGRDLSFHEFQTPLQMLLQEIAYELDEREKAEYLSQLFQNPERFLIIIDSLDTLRCALENEYKRIRITDKAPVGTILWNLLTSNIFPGCRIMTSSREHAIRNYAGDLCAHKVIALAGLTLESINKITMTYFDEQRGREILNHLETNTPALMKLCSTPVFLAFTLNGFDNQSDFQPKSMTGVLIQVLRTLIRSPTAKARNLEEIIVKLAHFAFAGTEQGKVLFDSKELKKYHLKEDDVSDLTVMAPRGESHRLLQVESYLYFSHQSIQEMLAAAYISRMAMKGFEEFLDKAVHSPRYSVIRRLLCGLLLDDDVQPIADEIFGDAEGIMEKREALKHCMKIRLQQKCGPVDMLEQMISLHEGLHGMKQVISTSLHEAIFHGIALSRSDAYVIGSVISQASALDVFALCECNLGPEVISIISSLLKESAVKISKFQVADNKNMKTEGFFAVGEVTKSCDVDYLDVGDCDLTPNRIKALEKSLQGSQMSQMLLRENKNIGIAGMYTLGDITRQCGVKKLGFGGCDLTAADIRAFRNSAKDVKLKSFVLNRILPHTPTKAEVEEIAELISNVTGELRLLGWNLEEKDRMLFRQKIEECQPRLKIILDEDDILSSVSETHAEEARPGTSQSHKSIAKTDVKQIGPGGGTIKVGNCEVYFPPKAVTTPTRFRVSLTIHPRRKSEENLRISSFLTCLPSKKFTIPVTVKLPTWCSTISNDVIAYIMAQDAGDQDPYLVCSVPLKGTQGIIEFKAFHFTRMWAYIRRLMFGELTFKVSPSLHFNAASGNFTSVFHVNDPVTAENCRKVLKDCGFRSCPVMLNTITMKTGDDVKMTLRCVDPDTHSFDPDNQQSFKAGEDFAEEDGKHLGFIITPRPTTGHEFKISCKIEPYDSRDKKFRLVWPEIDTGRRGEVHFHGDVDVENIIF